MLLATDLKIDKIKIPAEVRKAARQPEIMPVSASNKYNVLGYRPEFLACCYAWPHRDDSFDGEMFLTLCLFGNHKVCDAHTARAMYDSDVVPFEVGYEMEAGVLVVIDPMVMHWLSPNGAWGRTKIQSWAALQWTVAKRDRVAVAREIVTTFSGTWVKRPDIEPRLVRYLPS